MRRASVIRPRSESRCVRESRQVADFDQDRCKPDQLPTTSSSCPLATSSRSPATPTTPATKPSMSRCPSDAPTRCGTRSSNSVPLQTCWSPKATAAPIRSPATTPPKAGSAIGASSITSSKHRRDARAAHGEIGSRQAFNALASDRSMAMNLYVVAGEERYLARRFGAPYSDYCNRVRRWI